METNKKIERIARFVRAHGFAAVVIGGAVTFGIPYTVDGVFRGHETCTVRTFAEARNALGY